MQSTSGGGEDDRDDGDVNPNVADEGPRPVLQHFEPIPWDISSLEDMQQVLDFQHRLRLTTFAKNLLELPCMQSPVIAFEHGQATDDRGATWRSKYSLALATQVQQLQLAELQSKRLKVSHAEDDLDISSAEVAEPDADASACMPRASFAEQRVFATPSAYITSLVNALPSDTALTRDQTLFVARFAKACDEAWLDEKKPPNQRKVHHILLLGQGGSGKTHVVQNLVFEAIEYIWPPASPEEPTLMVVASSNAQAKNISTASVKARTLHNASAMRVQQYVNVRMRPGNKQPLLARVWGQVRALIIEEVSMVAAALYNMLDFRSMCGRSRTHEVTEMTYKKAHHHFGRIPIVIHLGDRWEPSCNIFIACRAGNLSVISCNHK